MARIPASNPITTEAVAEKQYPDLFISRITVQHIPNMLAKMSISASAYNYDTEEILSPKQVEVYHVKDLQAEVQRLPVLRDVLIKLRRVSGLMLWENRIVKFIDKTTERIAIIDELIASGVGDTQSLEAEKIVLQGKLDVANTKLTDIRILLGI